MQFYNESHDSNDARRRSPRGAALLSVILLASSTFLAVLLPGPAGAYPAMDSTFADGSTEASLTFGPGATSLTGPSLRLLTNSTVSFAQIDVAGALGHGNRSTVRDSTADFQSAQTLDGLTAASGSLALSTGTAALWVFDASNNFGGGTFSSTAVVNGSLVISAGSAGNYISPAISNTGEGWGYFTAGGFEDFYANVTFNLLDGGGALLLRNIEPGMRIPYTSWEQPSLSVEVVLTSTPGLPGPSVEWFALGQREADHLFGSGVRRTFSNVAMDRGAARTVPEPATLTKAAANPVIAKVASTYRSAFVGQPMILRVGSEWWMYFTASTTGDYADGDIARAVSTDLISWIVDAAPVLYNGTSGFDAYGIDNPYVMRNSTGFTMFYNGWTSNTACSIGRATSPDGINWTKDGQVMAPSALGWDSYAVGMVSRVTHDPVNSTWAMWYSGTDVTTGGGFSLGLAVSNNGVAWTKFFANPLLLRLPGGIDTDDLRGGKQIEIGNTVLYYYGCNNAVRYNVCLATSTTGGVLWTRVGIVLNVSAAGWDSQHVADPGVVLSDSAFYVFYSGYQSGQPQIGRASASFKAGSYTGRFDLLPGNSPNLVTFAKDGSNPRLAVASSTYYSTFLGNPFVIRINGTWTMYFSAGNGSGYQGATISRAVSGDLSNWVIDPTPALRPNASMNETYAIANPYVLADPLGAGFIMYYSAFTSSSQPRMMRATSPDGIAWAKTGEVLRKSVAGWDSYSVGMASRVEYDTASALWKMWFSGSANVGGGANSLGYATSADGISWTKYAANPVMTYGLGSGPDANDAQGGRMIRVGDNLAYYYSCHDGGTYHACLALSPDGLAWSKSGYVLNDSVSGWDSMQVSDPMPVVSGSSFYLFFAGTNGPTSQIGRATGVWNPTSSVPRLADLPRSLTRFVANATAGAGGSAMFSLRSSADGIVWSTPETVTANDTTLSTPVREFIEFTATLSAASSRASFFSGALAAAASVDQGRYVDASFSYADPVDRVRLLPVVRGGGSITWSVSMDGGTAWTPLSAGTDADIAAEPFQVQIEGRFRGYASAGPALDALNLTARTHGYPADVGIRPGAAGTRIAVFVGPFSSSSAVTIPPDDLNAAIAAALAANLSAAYVDVPLVVDSSHFGLVTLSSPVLHYTLQNPLTATYDPPGPAVTLAENTSASFSVAASTLPGVPLNYSWRLDGVVQATSTPSFTYSPDFSAAGPHTLEASVENGDFTQSWTWTVIVTNVNRPPTATGVPSSPSITQSYRQTANFSVVATDPDGEVLDYAWRLDGRLQTTETTNAMSVTGLPAGTHTVHVNVSDGLATVPLQWTLILTNSGPLASFTPTADVTLTHAEDVSLAVTASDPDGDPVEYSWKFDGAVQTSAQPTFVVSKPTPGNHTVDVSVYAAGAFVNHTWRIASSNAAPVLLSRTPAGGLANDTNASQPFAVAAMDPEGDALTFAWTLDGTRQSAAGASYDVPAGLPGGPHIVSVTITDAFGASAKAEWTFTVPPPSTTPPPATTSGGFIPGFEAAAVAAALAAACAIGWPRRRTP